MECATSAARHHRVEIYRMILTQLQPSSWRLTKRRMQRNLLRAKRHTQKLLYSKARKLRRSLAAKMRHQYFPTAAVQELKTAARHNEDIVIGTLLVALILAYGFGVAGINFMLQVFITVTQMSAVMGINALWLFVVAGITFSIASAWLSVFLNNMVSLALMQGANRKIYRSLRDTIRQSLAATGRVTTAWLLFAALLALPGILGAVVILTAIYGLGVNPDQALPYLVILVIAIIAGVITAAINYTLVPYVAFFEQHIPLKQTLGRSRQLVMRRGRLFILGIYLILGAFLALAFRLAHTIDSLLPLSGGLLFGMALLPALILTNGIFVTLYRKRRLARTI